MMIQTYTIEQAQESLQCKLTYRASTRMSSMMILALHYRASTRCKSSMMIQTHTSHVSLQWWYKLTL